METGPREHTLRFCELVPKSHQGNVSVGVGAGLVIDLDRGAGRCVGHPDGTRPVIDHPSHVDA
jgi:hypothetical protein